MRWGSFVLGMVIAAPALAQPATENEYAADEAVLRGQGLPTKGAELLQILRDRTPKPESIAQFKKLVPHLHSSPYVERVKATDDLRKMGPVVRPLLENLLVETKLDAETTGRLRAVLDQYPADKDFAAATAAARLLQRDKPAGGVPVLLDYVPYATRESVRHEVQNALNVLAKRDASTLLVDSLKDASAPRRAAAAEAILRREGLAAKKKIESLITDAHPLVRHQIGSTLVELHDKAGLPILIQALPDTPGERADHALELLYRAAGESAPDAPFLGKTKIDTFCNAWSKWYDHHHATLDLAKQMAHNELGFTVIATGIKVNANKIYELGPKGTNTRWDFVGPRYPVDVQILSSNRLLIAEYLDRRVTERDFKGNILWQHQVATPIAAQRLPNGNTFIATRSQLLIVDRDGNQTFTHTPQLLSITAAQWLRGGQMAVVYSTGKCALLDARGQEMKSFSLGAAGSVYSIGGNIEVLPSGRILAPLYNPQQIAEFDWEGNKLWSADVPRPTSVTRLANGHTLVTCNTMNRVIELDHNGKEVWSHQTDGRPFRARRR